MVAGLLAARPRDNGNSPTPAPTAPASKPRRDSMMSSDVGIASMLPRTTRPRWRRDFRGQPSARRRGRHRALAAFVQRSQAARSNRRYVYSINRGRYWGQLEIYNVKPDIVSMFSSKGY